MYFKAFSYAVFKRDLGVLLLCSMFCVFAKLLLMRKIGIVFLFKWICHFLSEGKMMIQED